MPATAPTKADPPLDQAPGSSGETSLKLAKGVSLTFEDDSLIVKDKEQAKKSRTRFCGVPIGSSRPELAIPFYNVLWAEVLREDGQTPALVIDYALEAKNHQVRPRKLTYALATEGEGEGNALLPETAESFAESLLARAYGPAQRRKRAKVLVNPHAGPGGAVKTWEQEVRPVFEAARMHIDATYTTQAGEAVGICQQLDRERYDVVVPCSGDGLPHEVFNGLGRRADARAALRQLAVAHIPCGSGNAMSCNLNGSFRPGPAALAIVKGVRTPLDMMSVTQGEGTEDAPVRRTLSFLSQSVGIVAESDLGTENMRWMGPHRFTVGVAQRIFSKKVYPCDVALKVAVPDKDAVRAHYRREKEAHEANSGVRRESGAADASADSVDSSEVDVSEGLPSLRYGSINDKVPDDWEKLSLDKMGNFYCGNMPYMAPDANFFPATTPNDGLMDLVVNDGDIPALQYLELMTSIEKERYYDNPLVAYRKVTAYRITPRQQDATGGYISIDGERIPFEPFQVEVHPGLATVLSRRGRYEANGPSGWENATAAV